MLDLLNKESSKVIRAPIDGTIIRNSTFVSSNIKYQMCNIIDYKYL